jgi:hypothetical protein
LVVSEFSDASQDAGAEASSDLGIGGEAVGEADEPVGNRGIGVEVIGDAHVGDGVNENLRANGVASSNGGSVTHLLGQALEPDRTTIVEVANGIDAAQVVGWPNGSVHSVAEHDLTTSNVVGRGVLENDGASYDGVVPPELELGIVDGGLAESERTPLGGKSTDLVIETIA